MQENIFRNYGVDFLFEKLFIQLKCESKFRCLQWVVLLASGQNSWNMAFGGSWCLERMARALVLLVTLTFTFSLQMEKK
jgi:hypothetical protein